MKITVHLFASDDENGTQAEAFATEREAEDALLEAHDETRQTFNDWCIDNPDGCVWDFVEGKAGDLDTYNVDERTIDVPVQDVPVVAALRDASRAVVDAYGGDVPDWLREEFAALEDALAAL